MATITHPTTTATRTTRRPRVVSWAAALQVLVALAWLSIPVVGLVYGSDVQAAGDAELVRQGLPADTLTRNGIPLGEAGGAIMIPAAIAAVLTVLAVLVFKGSRIGRIASFVVMPLVLLANAAVLASNASVVPTVEAVLRASADPAAHAVDVPAVLAAVGAAYPDWLPGLEGVRLVALTGGCVLAVVLLALRPARAWFRKAS
jgi:hypothetical protein